MKPLLTLLSLGTLLLSCTPANTTPAGSNSPTQAATVTIKNNNFSPASLNVKAGSQVTFKNEDAGLHTATADDGSFNTGNIESGKSATVTISKSATYKCGIHSSMKGSINLN